MNGPRRLNQSGGYSELLLRSASIDRPSEEARRRAVSLASTTSAFATTTTESRRPQLRPIGTAKVLAKWISIGAAAGGILALGGSQLLDSASKPDSAANGSEALPELPASTAAAPLPPQDISPEPTVAAAPLPSSLAASPPAPSGSIRPWVASPLPVASTIAPAPNPAKTQEAREIEAAREAVSRGDESAAIAQLNDYEHAHPNGALAPEAMALRIQALANSGKTGEAKTLAGEFETKYPSHPLSGQIKSGTATSRTVPSGGPSTPK